MGDLEEPASAMGDFEEPEKVVISAVLYIKLASWEGTFANIFLPGYYKSKFSCSETINFYGFRTGVVSEKL